MQTPFFPARWSLLLSAGSMLLVTPASADRAALALEQSVTGETNLFRSEDDEEADGSYEIRPRLSLERPAGELRYRVEYSPTYQLYFKTNGIDGFDQFGKAELSYAPLPTGTATLRSDLAYYRSIRSEEVDGPGGIPEVVSGVSGRVFRGLLDAGYEHQLSPLTTATGNLGFQAYEYTTPNNADSIGVLGELAFAHELSPTLALGGQLLASHRRFDDLSSQPASENTVLHAGPTLRILPTPTLSFEAEVGPAWVLTHRDEAEAQDVARFRTTAGGNAAVFSGCGTVAGQPLLSLCPLVPAGGAIDTLEGQRVIVGYPPGTQPPSEDDDEITAFARALLRKDEEWGYGSLEYFRAEDASSGTGTSSIRDSLTGTLALEGSSVWSLRLRANWNQRETVEKVDETDVIAGPSPVPAGGGQFFAEAEGLVVVDRPRRKVNQYWLDARLRRRLTTALYAELDLRFLYQDRDGSSTAADQFENWRGVFMLRYELTPLDF